MRNETERNLRLLFGLVFVCVVGWYLYNQTNLFIRGPEIVFIAPLDGSNLSDPFVTVIGRASNVSWITLNGSPIFVDAEGNFSESLLLAPGYSILEVAVTDRFGRRTEKHLELFLSSDTKTAHQELDTPITIEHTIYGEEGTSTKIDHTVFE